VRQSNMVDRFLADLEQTSTEQTSTEQTSTEQTEGARR
jgi:hypothetical protein